MPIGSFSSRRGYVKVDSGLDSMSDRLRNRIWNVIRKYLPEEEMDKKLKHLKDDLFVFEFVYDLLDKFCGMKIDLSEYLDDLIERFEKFYDRLEWYEVYDLLEFVADYFNKNPVSRVLDTQQLMEARELVNSTQIRYDTKKRDLDFVKDCNNVLLFERTPYRFINNIISPISAEEEIKDVNNAISVEHCGDYLKTALQFLSLRINPKFRESIGCSIDAIECISQMICGKNVTFTETLKEIRKRGIINIPVPLYDSFKKLYGFASAYDIRHARGARVARENVLEYNLHEAKFFLLVCSAFVNYVHASYIENRRLNN